jgi:chromate transporter
MTRRDFLAVWVRIGLLSFGGPAGQIALMREEVVTRRGWVSEDGFQRGVDVAMLLPGPEAQQLATWLGWRVGGMRGGLVAGLCFILPGAALMTLLAVLTVTQGDTGWVGALFYGSRDRCKGRDGADAQSGEWPSGLGPCSCCFCGA